MSPQAFWVIRFTNRIMSHGLLISLIHCPFRSPLRMSATLPTNENRAYQTASIGLISSASQSRYSTFTQTYFRSLFLFYHKFLLDVLSFHFRSLPVCDPTILPLVHKLHKPFIFINKIHVAHWKLWEMYHWRVQSTLRTWSTRKSRNNSRVGPNGSFPLTIFLHSPKSKAVPMITLPLMNLAQGKMTLGNSHGRDARACLFQLSYPSYSVTL